MQGRAARQPPLADRVKQPFQRLEPGPVGFTRYHHQKRGQGAQSHLARRGQKRLGADR